MGQVAQCDNALPFHLWCPASIADNSESAGFHLISGGCLNMQKPLKGIQPNGLNPILSHTGVNLQWSYSTFTLAPLQFV